MTSFHQATRLRQGLGRLLAYLMLTAVFGAVHVAAYWIRFDGWPVGAVRTLMQCTLVMFVVCKLILYARYQVVEGPWSFASFHDLLVLAKATTVAAMVLMCFDYFVVTQFTIPRSILLLDWGATIVVLGGFRAAARWVRERGLMDGTLGRGSTRVLIVGANHAGELLLRAICRNPSLPYRVVGFIAETHDRPMRRIGSLPVVGTLEESCEVAERLKVRELLIADGELPGQTVRQLVDEGSRRNIGVKVLPSHNQLLEGRVDVRPRNVSIEDLLQREQVRLDNPGLHRWLEDKVVFVTGSAGSIGSEICRQILQFRPSRLVAIDRSENGQFFLERELVQLAGGRCEVAIALADLNDGPRLNRLFVEHRPEIVFHAAAYKHVPLMETHPGEAVKNITLTTRTLADLANACGVESFVMISTDKAVKPSSVMGACKRMAEMYIQAQAARSTCRFVTVRFGNVLDSAGSVVPIFREQIARGGPVTITHPDMRRYFMTIPEASQLVVQAGMMGRGGEIFVLDMGTPVRIVDLARDIIRLSGLREGLDIELKFTGLRPGEKLEEELLANDENLLATTHPKIMVAAGARPSVKRLIESLSQLQKLVDGPEGQVLSEFSRILPDFRSTEIQNPAPHLRRAA